MKLENRVCTLELAKKLKELGVKQESLFYWMKLDDDWKLLFPEEDWFKNDKDKNHINYFSAFTVAELGEMLIYLLEKNILSVTTD